MADEENKGHGATAGPIAEPSDAGPLPPWAQALARLTEGSGYTQAEVARQAGLQRDAFSRYLRGKSRPPPQRLIALARALGVRPSEIDPDRPALDEVATAAAAPGAPDLPYGSAPLWRLSPARDRDPSRALLEVTAELPRAVAQRIIDLVEREGTDRSGSET